MEKFNSGKSIVSVVNFTIMFCVLFSLYKQSNAIEKLNKIIDVNFADKFKNEVLLVSQNSLQEYQEKLKNVQSELEEEKQKIEDLKNSRQRLENGMPDIVSLEEVAAEYGDRISKAKNKYEPIINFITKSGDIDFNGTNISIAKIESRNSVAWIRIGKEDNNDTQVIIKSWISEAEDSKLKNGYKKIYERTKPSDYGQFTEKYFEKDDMYLKTHFQYDRVLESYGRHSLTYKFYIEFGSKSRAKEYTLEQYTYSLGS